VLAGSFLVPAPKTGVVAKAAEGAGYLERSYVLLARGATELALPLRQTGIKGAAVATAVGTGLVEGVHKLAPQPGYKGIGDDTSNEELDFDRASQLRQKRKKQALIAERPSTDKSAFDSEVNARSTHKNSKTQITD
jgi:hypothetical protein